MCEALNGKHLSVLGVFAPSRTEWPRRGQGCQSLLVTTMRRIRFPLLEPSVMWLSGWNSGIPLLIGKGCGLSRICQIMKPTFFFFFYFYVLRRTHAWEVWLLKCGMGGWKTHGIICRVFHSHPLMISFQNTPQLIKKAFKANRPWLLSGLDSHEKWHIFSVDSGSDGWFCSTLRWPCPSSACQNGGKSSLLCAFWLQANSVGLHHIVITAHELWSSLALELMSLSWNENK